LEIAKAAKLNTLLAGCLANLGTVTLLGGKVKHAENMLRHALALCDEFLLTRFSLFDALAQIDIFSRQLAACAQHLDDCNTVLSSHRVPSRSWYDLAHQVTRCSYFEQLHDWTAIVDVVNNVDPEVARRQYKALRTTLLCAKARALARLGQHADATTCLAQAVKTCPRSAVDPLIVLEASKAICATLGHDAPGGARHFDRALAACRAIEHRYHERWIDHARTDLAAATRARVTVPGPHPVDTTDAALLLTDVATVLGAGHSVDLMALRIVSLLEMTPLAPRVHVERASGCEYQAEPSATIEQAPDGAFRLHLRGSDRSIAVSVGGAQTLDDMSLLKSLADIVQAAVTRTVETEHETDEQNLWPRADVSTDEDAIFRSPRMMELRQIAIRLAETDLPVLITGETGTGKEIFARLIHEHSKQRRGPFVPVNCSAIPKELIESQLFGHRRGAFTGAADAFPGLIRTAEGGTLFLDEVGDLDLSAQPKLLRFLENGEIQPVGDLRPQHAVVRLVAATNANVDDAVRSGRLRQDLFYRLGVARIALPPLRERKDEIPALAALFVARSARECGRTGLTLGDDCVAALLLYDWPGNIRELVNEIRRVVALASDGATLSAADLSPAVAAHWDARPTRSDAMTPHGFYVRIDQPMTDAIDTLEQAFIEHALRATGGRVTEAANLLGISRKGLFLKRRRRGLVPGSTSDDVVLQA
jgi:DNA-binding NtrC family response regulator